MIGVDTNVMLRFLIDDDAAQNVAARRFMSQRTLDDPAFLSAVTLAEIIWVLHRRLKFSMAQIIEMIRALLTLDVLVVDHIEKLDMLINSSDIPPVGLADYLVVWSGTAAGCRSTMTFDKAAAKAIPDMELLS